MTLVKFVPRKRNVYMGICPWNVMLLAQYITDNSTAIEQKKNVIDALCTTTEHYY